MSSKKSTPTGQTDTATELTEDALTQVHGGVTDASPTRGIWDFSKKARSSEGKNEGVVEYKWKIEEPQG